MRFAQLTSSIEPTQANELKPTRCLRLQSRTTRPRSGLSQTKATVPPIAIGKPAVALSPSNGLITPSAPGPITRVRLEPKILRIWAAASGEYASCVPSRGESRTTPFTLCWTHSATTAGASSAEVTATARSTLPGTSLSLAYVLVPGAGDEPG